MRWEVAAGKKDSDVHRCEPLAGGPAEASSRTYCGSEVDDVAGTTSCTGPLPVFGIVCRQSQGLAR